jgi:hypothetical protein
MKAIEDLAQHVDRCSRDIRKARTVLVQKMIRGRRGRGLSVSEAYKTQTPRST